MASKGSEYVAVIESLTRLNNSVNGNPKYRLHLRGGSTADTQTDSSVAYEIQNSDFIGKPVLLKVTAAGRVWDAIPSEGHARSAEFKGGE